MSRDSSGNYTLPPFNPVTSGTIITSSWANGTCSDLGSELTNSLDRNGRGPMLAPLKLTDGAVNAPGLAFNSEPSTGLYRIGANDIRMSVAGQDAFGFSNIASVGKLTPYFPLDLTQQTVSPASGTTYDENPIINGACAVNQRSPAGVGLAPSGAYFLDRFKYLKAGTFVHTLNQGGGPGGNSVPQLPYAAVLTLTTPQASLGATDFCQISYAVEGYDAAPVLGRQITLSFWAYSTLAGTYSVSLRNSGTDRSCVATYTLLAATWTKVALTFPASPSAGTWNTTNGVGLYIGWTVACGTTNQTSALGVWQTGSWLAANTQFNGAQAGNTTFGITGLRIDPGPVAAPFRYKTFTDEFARCRRYFCKSFPYATAPAQNAGAAGALLYKIVVAGANGYALPVFFPTTMRITPTLTFFNPLALNSNWTNYSRTADSGAAQSYFGPSEYMGHIANPQVAADVVSQICMLHFTADAEL